MSSRIDVDPGTLAEPRGRGFSARWLDGATASHCERVGRYAARLAAAAGIQHRELEWVRLGGLLHDIGKAAVPRSVLNKPGRLNAGEWVRIRTHSIVGEEITAAMGLPAAVQRIGRHHHERWDGTGYPDGLSRDEIPVHARIVCVADVFDALASPRSYHVAHSRMAALRIMERQAGRLFDPDLLDTFRRLMGGDAPPRTKRHRGVAAA
jgi:putative nucleotidyltransferase with HDIG domain